MQLTNTGLDWAPCWSPDGSRIAFNRDGDLWVMGAVDGSDQVQLTVGLVDVQPAWARLACVPEYDSACDVLASGDTVPRDEAGVHLAAVTPSPFRAHGTIRFRLETGGPVLLRVFSAGGRLVRTLYEGVLGAGEYQMTWDGRDEQGRAAPSGVYLFRLETGQEARTTKAVLLR